METFSQVNIADVDHDLYDFVEEIIAMDYASKTTDDSANLSKTPENMTLTEEQEQFYLSVQPDCSYKTSDGLEYRMLL